VTGSKRSCRPHETLRAHESRRDASATAASPRVRRAACGRLALSSVFALYESNTDARRARSDAGMSKAASCLSTAS
jgi:hypothetical protein